MGVYMREQETFTAKRVTQSCETDMFDCGNGSIEARIKGMYYASLLREGYGYAIISRIDNKETVIGYYFLRLTTMVGPNDEMNEDYRSEIYGYENPFHYAVIEISFLAVRKDRQGEKIGTTVLAQIIKFIMHQAKTLPIRFIVIDALKEKVDWYTDIGFIPIGTYEGGKPTIKMYMDCVERGVLEQYVNGRIGKDK